MNLTFKIVEDWEDDLIWCPSQCYLKIKWRRRHFVIYLRWRNSDPWTAELIECIPNGDFDLFSMKKKWVTLPIFEWSANAIDDLKANAIKCANDWLIEQQNKKSDD